MKKELTHQQMEIAADSIRSYVEGEEVFGYKFPGLIIALTDDVITRMEEHRPNTRDLAITAHVIHNCPYTMPEDRTIHSFRAAQRKLEDLQYEIRNCDKARDRFIELSSHSHLMYEGREEGRKMILLDKLRTTGIQKSLFSELSQEIYYGMNFRIGLMDDPDFSIQLHEFLTKVRESRGKGGS